MNNKKTTVLAQYLKKIRLSQIEFSKDIGITPQRLHSYLTGKVIPPLEIALKIQEETKGKVKVSDWLKTDGSVDNG